MVYLDQGSYRKKTVLVVAPHADDMEFCAAGTVARFIEEKGYDVYQQILTDNSKGSLSMPGPKLAELSANEARAAGKLLGLKEVRFENYVDGELEEASPSEVRGKIMKMIREVRADIVMSWDPFAPGEEHPDHRRTAMATLEAATFSQLPLYYPEHKFPPYPVSEAYWFAKRPCNAEMFVDIASTIERKVQALLTHESQMALTIEMFRNEAEVLGLDIPMLEKAAPEDYGKLVEIGLRARCAAAGKVAGMEYAEQFRYQALGMLDHLMGERVITPDF